MASIVYCLRFRVEGFGDRAWGVGSRSWGLEFSVKIWNLGRRVVLHRF